MRLVRNEVWTVQPTEKLIGTTLERSPLHTAMSLHVVDHPLLKHQLANLRLASTTPKEFRQLVATISTIIGVEASKDLATQLVQGDGPLAHFEGEEVKERIGLVPILRAGLGMVDGEPARGAERGVERASC